MKLELLFLPLGTFGGFITYPVVMSASNLPVLLENSGLKALAVAFHEQRRDIPDLFSALAERFRMLLPEQTRIRYRTSLPLGLGSELGANHLTLTLGEFTYQLKLERGSLQASFSHIVGGITLKTEKLHFDQWVLRVQSAIEFEVGQNAVLRSNLEKIISQ